MKAAMIGDNCIDLYVGNEDGRKYPTGNVVDTGVNLRKLGVPVSIISTTGSDENGTWMRHALEREGLDTSHLKTGDGATAVTWLSLEGKERVYKMYDPGVLDTMKFDKEDVSFAASHDLVHTALWGNAEVVLPEIHRSGTFVSFDYADRLDSPIVEKTLPYVDLGFFSFHGKVNENVRGYLKDKVERGMKIAVGTFGEEGSLAYDGKTFTPCGIFKTESLVNTVGAGDSYISGFLYGILHKKSIAECMRLGASIASQVVQVFEPWIEGDYQIE